MNGEASTKNNPVVSVIVADDHALFRQGVQIGLASSPNIEVIGQVENGLELIKMLEISVPDVILLDIQMPIMGGVEALIQLKKKFPMVKVIVLSMHNDPSVIAKMMELGANSYLTKEAGSETIREAILTVFEEDYYYNELTNKGLLHNLRGGYTDSTFRASVHLTDKEVKILRLMSQEKSTKEIAREVDLSAKTVEAIRDKLKVKTGAKSMAGLVLYASRHGLLGDKDEYSSKIEGLSKEQLAHLFFLSTSVLAYVNHDLAGQRNTINQLVQFLKESNADKKLFSPADVNSAFEKLSDAIRNIGAINNLIKSHLYLGDSRDPKKIETLFLTSPMEVLESIKERNHTIKIEIDTSDPSLKLIYPRTVLLSIFSELIENAKKNLAGNDRIFFKWALKNNRFCCEVHDDGAGFLDLQPGKYVPLASIHSTSNSQSTGLGLRLIERTIIDSGGHLFFSNSEILKGAKVYFEFPWLEED